MSAVVSFTARPSLQDAIDAVHREFAKVFDANKRMHNARITTGRLLLDLRKRIEAGEAGEGIKWWDWYRENIVRSRKDGEKCMRLATAEDPDAAAEAERATDRERKRRNRGADVRSKNSSQYQDDSADDIVERALQLVEEMTAEQRQRFIVIAKEKYQW